MLRDEVSDPALTDVHVTSVVLSIDYRHARVHVSIPGSPASADGERARCERALTRATAFLRARLGEGLDLKRVPELRFVFDGVTPRGEANP